MDEISACIDLEQGQLLRDLLDGTRSGDRTDVINVKEHFERCSFCQNKFSEVTSETFDHLEALALVGGWSGFSMEEIWGTETHVRYCEICQEDPMVSSGLTRMKRCAEDELAQEIEKIKNLCLMTKYGLLAEAVGLKDSIERNDIYARIIEAFAQGGRRIAEEKMPRIFGDTGWDNFFRVVGRKVFVEDWDEYTEFPLSETAPFVARLPQETQHFLFFAVLASDLVGGRGANAQESGLDQLPKMEGKMQIRSCEGLCETLEVAAQHFLQQYLRHYDGVIQASQHLSATSNDPVVRNTIKKLGKEFKQHREDLRNYAASIEAGQMEIVRVWEREHLRAKHFESPIKDRLGEGLYGRLLPVTQQALQIAEYLYDQIRDPQAYSAPIMNYACAYDSEFLARVIQPVVQALVERRQADYMSLDRQLVRNGKPNTRLTTGQFLECLRRDNNLNGIAVGIGIHVDNILKSTRRLIDLRNEAVHRIFASHREAEEARNLLLGPDSILKALFSE